MVDGYWLEMLPQDYIVNQGDFCLFGFIENSEDYWVLGDAFFRGYYVIHDEQRSRIGIAPQLGSAKAELYLNELPTEKLP